MKKNEHDCFSNSCTSQNGTEVKRMEETGVLKPKQAFLIIHQTLNNPSDFISVSPSLKAQNDLWKMLNLFHTRQ